MVFIVPAGQSQRGGGGRCFYNVPSMCFTAIRARNHQRLVYTDYGTVTGKSLAHFILECFRGTPGGGGTISEVTIL